MAEKIPVGFWVLAGAAFVGGYLFHRNPPKSANELAYEQAAGLQYRGLTGFAEQSTAPAGWSTNMSNWAAKAINWATAPYSLGGGGFSRQQALVAISAAAGGNQLTPSEQSVIDYLYGSPAGPPPSVFAYEPSTGLTGIPVTSYGGGPVSAAA